MTLTFIIFGLKWYYLCVAGGIIVWTFKIWPSGKIEDLGDSEYSTMSEARGKRYATSIQIRMLFWMILNTLMVQKGFQLVLKKASMIYFLSVLIKRM